MLGVIAAFGAALCWTLASATWRKLSGSYSSIQLNTIKNFLATLFFLPALLSFPWLSEWYSACILFLSGAVGIAIGDTFYLSALRILGTRRTLTIESLAPILAGIFGAIFLQERYPIRACLGAFLVTISVVLVASEAPPENESSNKQLIQSKYEGLAYAFVSLTCGITAAMLSRMVFIHSELLPFHTSAIRIFSALILLLPVFFKGINIFYSGKKVLRSSLPMALSATLLGTNLGMFLQQMVFQRLPLGVGVTILSSTPVMSLLFATGEGDQLKFKGVLASLMSLLGVGLVMS